MFYRSGFCGLHLITLKMPVFPKPDSRLIETNCVASDVRLHYKRNPQTTNILAYAQTLCTLSKSILCPLTSSDEILMRVTIRKVIPYAYLTENNQYSVLPLRALTNTYGSHSC